jgi:drug/metabolite transporter (DMT)-like permease
MLGMYGLVLVSAMMHAYWNFLVKRRGGSALFVALTKMAEVAVFAPAFAVALAITVPGRAVGAREVAILIGVGAALTLVNYIALARAYTHGHLSFVYPVSRGAGLLFLPPLGFLVFGERLDRVGWTALSLILAGLLMLQLPEVRSRWREGRLPSKAIGFALLAGLAAACYTVWDKRAIGILPGFVYFYSYSVLVAVAYGAFMLRRHPASVIGAEWRANRWAIVQVGVFNTGAYLLVLTALRTSTSSYVIALRQLSIVFGVALGWWQLGERVDRVRAIALSLLLLGCGLVALAR